MNKKLVTLILVILISFSFLSIVVADSTSHNDKNTTDHDKKVHKDKKTTDKNKTKDKNKTDDKPNKNYILAMGSGNDIRFSDGFRGFILDYSKSPASSGDEFKRVSTSNAADSNTLKMNIIKGYMQDSEGQIGKLMASSVKSNSSSSKAAAVPQGNIGDHEVVKINNETEAVFDFEVLKSVSGNVSDYFAYKVSFRNVAEQTNLTNTTNTTNITNLTSNATNITQQLDNETNATFLKELFDYLSSLANALFDAWKPIIDTLINNLLMAVTALVELANLIEDFMAEMQLLMDALGKLLEMLQSIWDQLEGLLKLLTMILNLIQQLLDLISYILNLIAELISALIALLEMLLELLYSLIQFLIDLINQLIALIQAILEFLKSVGSFLINVIENAIIIIVAFLIITLGAFIYNRIR